MCPAKTPHETLEFARNMEALRRVDPALRDRIFLPVDGSHVQLTPSKPPLYKVHRRFYPFVVEKKDLPGSMANVEGQRDVFLFGIGLGEQLDYLLDRFPGIRVIAWDRDPWLLRLVLSRRDYSEKLLSEQLRLLLCADLLENLPIEEDLCRVVHPFLGPIYRFEQRLLDEGVGKKRALLQAGALFVDDMAMALNRMGYSLFTLDTGRLSREEQERIIGTLRPSFIAAINYKEGLAEFCFDMGCPLVCWEIDPSLSLIPPVRRSSKRAHIFTYRRANVDSYCQAGFENVEYLPLAADPERRAPRALGPEEKKEYAAPLVFVGASLVRDAFEFRRRFLDLYTAWHGEGAAGEEEGSRLLEETLTEQRKDFSAYRLPTLLEERFHGFLADSRKQDPLLDPIMLAAQIAASEKRLTYVANLGRMGVKVWGDKGWAEVQQHGVRYMGRYASHTEELTKVYCGARINVDIGRLYQSDIVTMRVFDVLACGGFLLAEESDALLELFEPDKEVAVYRTMEELREKAAYYLANPEAARKIASQGMEKVRRDHTIPSRVAYMLQSAGL